MDHNEITIFMDVKVDLQDKRPESASYRHWNRCQVRIEAVKCLPCFLRITFEPRDDHSARTLLNEQQKPNNLTISINVPGVVITLASSRTKHHSYAVSWMQNRRNCYIYFALDTELACRRHMKWLRKSIKNLELHRKIMLEERETSRGAASDTPALGPLPLLPGDFEDSNSTWSQRVSEIYEEILDRNQQDSQQRLSRRCSRSSIASGIYEEMKAPFNASTNFESINEEMSSIPSTPPPLPPLPSQRKRFNTYELEENAAATALSDEIPRSNTNPETEMAKKKKYKNVLETFFHGSGLRSKRTVSVSDDSKEHISGENVGTSKAKQFVKAESSEKSFIPTLFTSPPQSVDVPVYANDDAVDAKCEKKPSTINEALYKYRSKRNSFSSPDLSKINFVDTFDEQRIAELLSNSYSKCEELDLMNSASLDETDFMLTKTNSAAPNSMITKTNHTRVKDSNEDQNISQQIPNNFNFSACNSSTVNLIASLSSQQSNNQTQKNKIIFDDLSGYCVMAPIVKKMSAIDNTPLPLPNKLTNIAQPVESASSGYSTGSHCSSTSSCTNSSEDPNQLKPEEPQPTIIQEENVVYENMQGAVEAAVHQSPTVNEFTQTLDTGNLYENLLAIKAAQELEHIPIAKISTSTPTDPPRLEPETTPNITASKYLTAEEENYYQTPRKSIISIDEKVPSYYPNTCESSVKSRRRSYSPARINSKNFSVDKTPTSSKIEKSPSTTATTPVLRHFMSSKKGYERKENIYLTSPQGVIEQRRKSKGNSPISPNANISSKIVKTKKTAAHKISENVYAVTHCLKKSIGPNSTYNNTIENKPLTCGQDIEIKDQQLHSELPNLAILQNIDFKFEGPNVAEIEQLDVETKITPTSTLRRRITTRTPNRNITSSPHLLSNSTNNKIRTNSVSHSSAPNTTMSQSTITNNENIVEASDGNSVAAGIKKFASLPRFKKFNLSPLRTRINNVLQRNHTPDL